MKRLLLWLWAPIWGRLKPLLLRARDAALLLASVGAVLWVTGATRGAAWADDLLDAETVHIEVGEEPPWLTVHINVRQPTTISSDACPPPRYRGRVHTPCELPDGPAPEDTGEASIEEDEPVGDDESKRGEL